MPDRMPLPPSTNELEQVRYALDQAAIVAITDAVGRISDVNQKFCEISQYSRQELIGQDHRMLNSGFHPPEFIRDLWETITRGDIWRGEFRNRAKDGSLYWVDTTIVPFLNADAKPWQYMAIRYDITERKQSEERLYEHAALMKLGEMAAVVAHEVRNPLAGLRSGMQLLTMAFPEAAEGRQLLADMIGRLDSLNAVVSDLLTFARVRELSLLPVNAREFLQDLVASLRLDPAMKTVHFEVVGDRDLTMLADLNELRVVFMNLLLNAAQAMNHCGRIFVQVTSETEWLRIVVSDYGPGIPAHRRERIFEPFFTTKHRGTGLGLPTARRIVEAHGGTLAVGDGPNGGTAMSVTLRQAEPGVPLDQSGGRRPIWLRDDGSLVRAPKGQHGTMRAPEHVLGDAPHE